MVCMRLHRNTSPEINRDSENRPRRNREASVKYFSEVTRSEARNKEAQFRNNQINFLRCCLISWESRMARRAAGVYHAIQSTPAPLASNRTHYYQSQDFTPE